MTAGLVDSVPFAQMLAALALLVSRHIDGFLTGRFLFCGLTSGLLKELFVNEKVIVSPILEFGLPWPFTHVLISWAIMFNKLCKEMFFCKLNMNGIFGQTAQKRPFADLQAILDIYLAFVHMPYTFTENSCLRGICPHDVNDLPDTNQTVKEFPETCTLAGLCLDWSFLLLQKARTWIPTGTDCSFHREKRNII